MKVSVIIPMYNARESIEKCINSILNQTIKNTIELIIINDGSTDDSAQIVESLIKNYSGNISIKQYSKENGGVSSARNLGLKKAKGELIAFLDSDDEWLPDKLETQIQILEKDKNIVLLGGNINDKPISRFYLKKFDYLTEIKLIDQIFKNFFQPSTVIIKRSILKDVGYFPEDQRHAEEGNFFFKIAAKYKCVLVNEKLLNYGIDRVGDKNTGLSGNLKEMQKGEIRNLKFAYQQKYISTTLFIIAYCYSYIKYVRRLIVY